MNIERSIYTHTKVRRDTRSTGFGYYSMTPGMEQLLSLSSELSAVSLGYIAPKNSECWWESNQQDTLLRDETEAARIREHHPVCFGYTVVNVSGRDVAALTFGRNLGRDLSAMTRDGNILVNTLALNSGELRGYPYIYYGSPELFLDHERGYFLNAGDEPAEPLEPLQQLTAGSSAPAAGDIEMFLNEEDRLAALISMLRALMEINDGGSLRRIIVCDSKENIINWVAALSMVYPEETARNFTFRTYSFFGCNTDDFTPVYDDVMFCGAYTPAVNGDSSQGKATNYDFAHECQNESSAVFDFEQGYCEQTEEKHPYFDMFIESAFSTDLRILKSYHDFIRERTSCRSLGSDYAKGYGCYTILQLKNENSLKYITDAADFALGYMDEQTARQLLTIAYSLTVDSGKEGRHFEEILDVSLKCISSGAAAAGFVRAHYISFLIRLVTAEDTQRDDYYRLKERIRGVFAGGAESIEAEFVSAFTVQGITMMTSSVCKRWKLIELADCVSKVMADESSHFCGTDDELSDVFDRLTKKIIISEQNDRPGLIAAFADMFPQPAQRAAYLVDMYGMTGEYPDIRRDVLSCIAGICITAEREEICSIADFAESQGISSELAGLITEHAGKTEDLAERAELYVRIIDCADGRLDDAFMLFVRDLEVNCQGSGGVYLVFSLVKRCGRLADIDVPSFCKRYYTEAAKEYGRYGLDTEAGDRLLEIAAALDEPLTVLRGVMGNMATMHFVRRYAAEPDKSRMCLKLDDLEYINFELMRKSEREDCIAVLGAAFAERSHAINTALAVDYDAFINCDDERNKTVTEELFLAWLSFLAEDQQKDSPRLMGQVLAVSAVRCRLPAQQIAELLNNGRIKPDDIKPGLFSHEVMSYLDRTSERSSELKGYLNSMMRDIENCCGTKTASPFGRLRSKLGGSARHRK